MLVDSTKSVVELREMYLGPVEKKAWGEQNQESVVRFREGKRTSFSDAIRNARRLFGPAFSAR